jgi:hypothetical protein
LALCGLRHLAVALDAPSTTTCAYNLFIIKYSTYYFITLGSMHFV